MSGEDPRGVYTPPIVARAVTAGSFHPGPKGEKEVDAVLTSWLEWSVAAAAWETIAAVDCMTAGVGMISRAESDCMTAGIGMISRAESDCIVAAVEKSSVADEDTSADLEDFLLANFKRVSMFSRALRSWVMFLRISSNSRGSYSLMAS